MSSKRKITSDDLSSLKALLSKTQAQVLSPSDDGYNATLERWSRAAEKPSGVSVVPTTAEEVAIAVKYATENNLDLAVKGGGHSTSGASSTNGGVLINLGKMRGVRVDSEKKLLYVQGGCLWSDVDAAAWEHGLATVGGTVADTGVGGLTLGGGYGHLTGKYGLVIDNLVEATVVLANGEILRTSETDHPDLFWALRGAGQNFGVTTEFVLKAYQQSEVFGGLLLFPPAPEIVTRVVTALNDLYQVRDTPDGPATIAAGRCGSLFVIAKPPPAGGQTMLLVVTSFNGSEAEGRAVLKPLYDIGPVADHMSAMPWPKVNNLIPTEIGLRSSMKGAAYGIPLRPEFVGEIVSSYDEFLGKVPDAGPSIVAFEYYDAVKVVALDNGSFANRGYHMNGLVMPTWKEAANDSACRQFARDLSHMFKVELQAQGNQTNDGIESAAPRGKKGATMLYGNYDQYDEISKDIFGEHHGRLQSVKGKYDPTNTFNKLHPIAPPAINGGKM